MSRTEKLRLRLAVTAAIAMVAIVAGCGIPSDDGAILAQPADVPFDLLGDASSTSTSAPSASPTTEATIFLVQGERLAPVRRDLASPLSVKAMLEALAAGPRSTEVQLGLRTALLAPDLMRSGGVVGGIATVDLGPAFADIAGRDQILALAQIVSTLTGLPGVGRVSFTIGGAPIGVPRGDGAVTTDSVSRDDYATLAPVPLG